MTSLPITRSQRLTLPSLLLWFRTRPTKEHCEEAALLNRKSKAPDAWFEQQYGLLPRPVLQKIYSHMKALPSDAIEELQTIREGLLELTRIGTDDDVREADALLECANTVMDALTAVRERLDHYYAVVRFFVEIVGPFFAVVPPHLRQQCEVDNVDNVDHNKFDSSSGRSDYSPPRSDGHSTAVAVLEDQSIVALFRDIERLLEVQSPRWGVAAQWLHLRRTTEVEPAVVLGRNGFMRRLLHSWRAELIDYAGRVGQRCSVDVLLSRRQKSRLVQHAAEVEASASTGTPRATSQLVIAQDRKDVRTGSGALPVFDSLLEMICAQTLAIWHLAPKCELLSQLFDSCTVLEGKIATMKSAIADGSDPHELTKTFYERPTEPMRWLFQRANAAWPDGVTDVGFVGCLSLSQAVSLRLLDVVGMHSWNETAPARTGTDDEFSDLASAADDVDPLAREQDDARRSTFDHESAAEDERIAENTAQLQASKEDAEHADRLQRFREAVLRELLTGCVVCATPQVAWVGLSLLKTSDAAVIACQECYEEHFLSAKPLWRQYNWAAISTLTKEKPRL